MWEMNELLLESIWIVMAKINGINDFLDFFLTGDGILTNQDKTVKILEF